MRLTMSPRFLLLLAAAPALLAASEPPGDDPLLVTTADNVLLTPTMIAEFLGGAGDSDVAVAMVERDILLARYPQSKRTWLKFRGGWWSGRASSAWCGWPG